VGLEPPATFEVVTHQPRLSFRALATESVGIAADVQVEVEPEVLTVGINAVHPAVSPLMEVVQVVLAAAAGAVGRGCSLGFRHTDLPSVVFSDHDEDVSVQAFELTLDVIDSKSRVGIRIIAVVDAGTLVRRELEQTDFSSSATL